MPAALTFPIGSRFYDWKYETEPEPFMNGRRVYHARGKVLGGSRSINGMIFQRGNPMDYERWAADPGMETWDYAHCLPYFKRMENCLAAGPTTFRGHAGPLVLERGPATNPLFDAFFEAVRAGRLPAHRRRQRLPPGGLRPLRPQHPPRPAALSAARAYLHPVMDRAEPHGRAPARSSQGAVRRQPRHRRRVHGTGKRRRPAARHGGEGRAVRRSVQHAAAAAALRRRQRASSRPLGIPVVHDLPGVGEHMQDHLEVYVQHACTQPVSLQPSLQKWRAAVDRRPVAVPAQGPGRDATTSSRGGFARSNDDVAYPNLMFHFLPIAVRYDGIGAGRRPRLPGAHRPDVLRRPRAR